VLVQTPFSRLDALERRTARTPAQSPCYTKDRRQQRLVEMIKTFSLSALFFLTIGVLFATHAALPF
jgi:hypothetical protein